ncbi:OmpH family outer membrane protein [Sphingobium ummariense]|uniref:Membrane protein n=1 Tax=Sphingobium ummariense RL-3 TaxID=1346791 RepID=T0ITC1_9SPHN|nr:OmpH family outer membrane protein [Sphingobium ummariense]EQB32085.1 membrane protein [Sphingobium ummariense RL-3]
MKTIIKAAALTLAPLTALAFTSAPAAAQSKTGIAVVDLQRAVATSAAYTAARTQIQTTYKAQIDSFTARKNAIDADLKTKGDALQAALKAANNKPTPAIETQYQQFQQSQQSAQTELQTLSQPIALANAYVEEQITAKLSDALKSAMTKAKVDLVLAPDATVSYQPTVDITQSVVTELNTLVPSVGITPPAGWQPGRQGQAPAAAAAPANPQQPKSR